MKKYRVSIPYNADFIVEVEAENEEKAIELAYNEGPPFLCSQCSDHLIVEIPSDLKLNVEELE